MKPIKIMVDVDSTLYDAVPIVRKSAEACGITWPDDPKCWVTAADCGVDSKELEQVFLLMHGEETVSTVEPYSHARDELNNLMVKFPLDIWYVSNRSPDLDHILVDWLTHHGFPNATNTYTSWDKHHWISTEEPYAVIDDRVKTILHAWSLGIEVFSIQQPWNINLRHEVLGVTLCPDWPTLSEALDIFLTGLQADLSA